MPRKVKNPVGRPNHEPTKATRHAVQILAAGGHRREVIAKMMGMALNTLRKHYLEDLKLGKEMTRARLETKLVQSAMGDSATSAKDRRFWLERKGGYEKATPETAVNVGMQVTLASDLEGAC